VKQFILCALLLTACHDDKRPLCESGFAHIEQRKVILDVPVYGPEAKVINVIVCDDPPKKVTK